jgi:hypothetical protein
MSTAKGGHLPDFASARMSHSPVWFPCVRVCVNIMNVYVHVFLCMSRLCPQLVWPGVVSLCVCVCLCVCLCVCARVYLMYVYT